MMMATNGWNTWNRKVDCHILPPTRTCGGSPTYNMAQAILSGSIKSWFQSSKVGVESLEPGSF